MTKRKVVLYSVLAFCFIFMLATFLLAFLQENKIKTIKVGMSKASVEQLLGAGRENFMSPACESCPDDREQLNYRGNPSIWYGHLEDSLVVCFVAKKVCGLSRVGL